MRKYNNNFTEVLILFFHEIKCPIIYSYVVCKYIRYRNKNTKKYQCVIMIKYKLSSCTNQYCIKYEILYKLIKKTM